MSKIYFAHLMMSISDSFMEDLILNRNIKAIEFIINRNRLYVNFEVKFLELQLHFPELF